MMDAMVVRGYSVRTHRSHLDSVSKLSKYYHCSPAGLNVDQIQGFFLYLAKERGLSGASCRLYLNAIRFLYLNVLEWQSFDVSIQIPKKAQRIPELLTVDEVRRILAACKNTKHRNLLMTTYGCGLRVSEVVALRVRQIDGERGLLRIEQGQGQKDRLVELSNGLLQVLRDYCRIYRPRDWLYYGLDPRQPIGISSVQTAFYSAKCHSGVDKIGGIHSLRHAYATHQLTAGMAIHRLQVQLGHRDIHTTMGYLHWVPNAGGQTDGVDLVAQLEPQDE